VIRAFSAFPEESPGRRIGLAALTWTWCLPNTAVSCVASAVATALGGVPEPFHGSVVIRMHRLRGVGGVCLGPVILVPDSADETFVRHEWGHFRQHLRLGPLYFVLVGLPSVTHALWHRRVCARVPPSRRPSYFHFYTEAWADALGGVYEAHAHVHPRWTGYLRLRPPRP
jgi:hypothetical protein